MKYILYISFILFCTSCGKNNNKTQPILTLREVIDSIKGTYITTKITYYDTSIAHNNIHYDTLYNVPLIITKLNDSMIEIEGKYYNYTGQPYSFVNTDFHRWNIYTVDMSDDLHNIAYQTRYDRVDLWGFKQFGHK